MFQTFRSLEVRRCVYPKGCVLTSPSAYDEAVVSKSPFEAVIHAASPYHFKASTPEAINDLITTAVNGTVGILEAVKAKAPSVKQIVVTSSFAAIVDPKKPVTYKYSEKDWDPVTPDEALEGPLTAYRASKTFAERAAWDFVAKEKPNFSLTTVSPQKLPRRSQTLMASGAIPHSFLAQSCTTSTH